MIMFCLIDAIVCYNVTYKAANSYCLMKCKKGQNKVQRQNTTPAQVAFSFLYIYMV